jgi:hypothetical protein
MNGVMSRDRAALGFNILMSCASFSPADFASAIGYLGPAEATLYYPTGIIQRDRIFAFTTAMDCLDDLEVYNRGNDDTEISTKLLELAQALSDLGLHAHALITCGFALEIFEGPYAAPPDTSRLEVASVLSLQASNLCDLKRKDESIDAAPRAVALCKEHRDFQGDPVPEVPMFYSTTPCCSAPLGSKTKVLPWHSSYKAWMLIHDGI